jgi:MinD-like ATPase involved in chromosome partitioning or flagellar assembly
LTEIGILTAVTGAAWESDLISALERGGHGVLVARRCVDLADLLAAAAAGLGAAALVSADLRRLDRDAVARLDRARVAVVGLIDPGDDGGAARLRQIGVQRVLAADQGAEAIVAAVMAGVREREPAAAEHALGDPRAALPAWRPLDDPAGDGWASVDGRRPGDSPNPGAAGGKVVAVWGATGAPGRSTVALGLADEAARLGVPALLIDADSYGGVQAQACGLLDEAPGLAAAVRQAGMGTLSAASLTDLALLVAPSFRLLTGISRPNRWPELRASALDAVFATARQVAALTVIDCGFCVEQDEEIVFDTMAPRRNGATIAALAAADVVLAVGAADPIGIQRLVRALDELSEQLPDVSADVVFNRVRRSVAPGDPVAELTEALVRYAGRSPVWFLPDDRAAVDRSLATGKTLGEIDPSSPLRLAIVGLARALTGAAESPRRLRRRSARARSAVR